MSFPFSHQPTPLPRPCPELEVHGRKIHRPLSCPVAHLCLPFLPWPPLAPSPWCTGLAGSISSRHRYRALPGSRVSCKSALPLFQMRKLSPPCKSPVIMVRIMNKPYRDRFSNEMREPFQVPNPDRRFVVVSGVGFENHVDAPNSVMMHLHLHLAKEETSKEDSMWTANRKKRQAWTLKTSGFSGASCLFLRQRQLVASARAGCGSVLSSNLTVSLFLKPAYFPGERMCRMSSLLLFKTSMLIKQSFR